MATTAPSSILEPEQQQAGPGESTRTLTQSQYSSSSTSAWRSSGSIGPFFAVMTVLAVLAVLSCYLGCRLNGRKAPPSPLESVTGRRGCFAWVRRLWRQCTSKFDVEEDKNEGKFKEEPETQVV